MPASISVAMIVRDEADHLTECLESVGRFADQVCVVDTGSSDETPDIARRFGAMLATFPWSDDFSRARNRALELCSGDWVFVVDADERIAAKDAPEIRRLAEAPADRGYRFVTRNYGDNEALADFHPCAPEDALCRGFRGWTPSTKVRLFPNSPAILFEGAVHELVNASLQRQGMAILDCEVPVHHYPLLRAPERIRRKQELYVALGRRKAVESPNDPKCYLELGNQYAEMGEAAEAVRSYREGLRLAPHDPSLLKGLGVALHLAGRGAEAERALELALRLEPDSPEAWRNLGVVRGDRGNWASAVDCFHRALGLNPIWNDGFRYLSVALEHAGRPEEAAEAAEQALLRHPSSAACLQNFLGQMARLGREEHAQEVLRRVLPRGRGD